MEGPRAERLHEILKRLGEALHRSVVSSSEVQACLDELHEKGWDAVMLLEASVVCREDGQLDTQEAALHIHADPPERPATVPMTAEDARLLRRLGIATSDEDGVRSLPGTDDPADR